MNKYILFLSMEPKEFLLLTMAQFSAKISGQLIQEGKYFASICVRIRDLSNICHWTGRGRMFPQSLCLTNSLNSPVITRPVREVRLMKKKKNRRKAFITRARETTYCAGEFHPGLSAEIISTKTT